MLSITNLIYLIIAIVAYVILRLLKGARREPIRPPGAVEELEFLSKCIRCGKCLEICLYNAIELAAGDKSVSVGTPFIVPRNAPCYLCMRCIEVCPTGALQKKTNGSEDGQGSC